MHCSFAMAFFATIALAAVGCATGDASIPIPALPTTAEECPGTFNACVELCSPRGVRHFACYSAVEGIDFECECLDGAKPLENDTTERRADAGTDARVSRLEGWAAGAWRESSAVCGVDWPAPKSRR